MPEGPEIRIMSDFINLKTSNKIFKSAYHVHKGNMPEIFEENDDLKSFSISSTFRGKKLILNVKSSTKEVPIYIFMGMSGSWKWVKTEEWSETKFTRLRFDSIDGYSLIMFGGYMGPKYSLYQNFKSSKNGPDIVEEYDEFINLISKSLNDKVFDKPIYEVLLDQKYFNGIGNYLRSTILYYADVNPFLSARDIINENSNFLRLCRDTLVTSYKLNGGQLKDWTNPFEKDSSDFDEWVYYQKGISIKDKNNRTFWFDPKWKQ